MVAENAAEKRNAVERKEKRAGRDVEDVEDLMFVDDDIDADPGADLEPDQPPAGPG